jgi:hypothetical protein
MEMKNASKLYRLNSSRSWEPKGQKQIRATAIVEDYFKNRDQAALGDIQDHLEAHGLGQIMDTHGRTSLWLARKSRRVIIENEGREE